MNDPNKPSITWKQAEKILGCSVVYPCPGTKDSLKRLKILLDKIKKLKNDYNIDYSFKDD